MENGSGCTLTGRDMMNDGNHEGSRRLEGHDDDLRHHAATGIVQGDLEQLALYGSFGGGWCRH